MTSYNLPHLVQLEHEAVYIFREVAAQFERPTLLFSGGKDSSVLVHLAGKAFCPAKIPFPLLHIDTGHNFPETLAFRDALVERLGLRLIVRCVEDTIRTGRVQEEPGTNASRNALQTVTLLDAIAEFQFDACIGGGRRDEEKARAKERIFSHRDEFGQWDPKTNAPNSGTYSTDANARANTSVSFPSAIGRNWISGSISNGKSSTCHRSILPTNARYSNAMGQF